MKLTRPFRFQRWGPLKGHYSNTNVVLHSRWRARLGLCKCMGCAVEKSGGEG